MRLLYTCKKLWWIMNNAGHWLDNEQESKHWTFLIYFIPFVLISAQSEYKDMPCETHLCKHSENPPLWVIKSELLWIPSPYSSKPNHSKSAEISQLWSQFLAITGMLSLSYLNHSIDQFNQKSKAFMNQFLKLFHTKHENFLADRNFFAMFCLALYYRA